MSTSRVRTNWQGEREISIYESAARSRFESPKFKAARERWKTARAKGERVPAREMVGTLGWALARIGSSSQLRDSVEACRAAQARLGRDSAEYRDYKATQLWAITAGARFTGRRDKDGYWQGTGALVLDFDKLDAGDVPRVRDAAMGVKQSATPQAGAVD